MAMLPSQVIKWITVNEAFRDRKLVVYYLPALLTDTTFRREIDRLFAAGVLLAEPVTSPATGPSREGGGTYIHSGFRINYSLALRSGGQIHALMESADRTAVVFDIPGNPLLGKRPDGSAVEPTEQIRGVVFAVILDMNGINSAVGRIGVGGPVVPRVFP